MSTTTEHELKDASQTMVHLIYNQFNKHIINLQPNLWDSRNISVQFDDLSNKVHE